MLVQDYLRLFDADHNLRLVEGLARYGVLNLSSPAQAAAAAQYAAAVEDHAVEEELIAWAESLSADLEGNRCVAECTMYMREEPEKTEGMASTTSSLGGYVSPETPHEMYASSPSGWSDSGLDGPVAVFGNSRSKVRADLTMACFFVDDGDDACESLSCDLWGHNRVWMRLGSEAETSSIFQPNAPAGGVKGTVSVGTFAVDDSEDSTGDGTFSMAVESQVGPDRASTSIRTTATTGSGLPFLRRSRRRGVAGRRHSWAARTTSATAAGTAPGATWRSNRSQPARDSLTSSASRSRRIRSTTARRWRAIRATASTCGTGRSSSSRCGPSSTRSREPIRRSSSTSISTPRTIRTGGTVRAPWAEPRTPPPTAIVDEIRPTDSDHRLSCYLSSGVVGDRWAAWSPADYEFGPSLPGDDVRAVFPVSDLSLGIFVDGLPPRRRHRGIRLLASRHRARDPGRGRRPPRRRRLPRRSALMPKRTAIWRPFAECGLAPRRRRCAGSGLGR